MNPDNWDTMYWLAKQYILDPEDWERRYDEWDDIPEGLDAREMESVVHYFESKGFCFGEMQQYDFDWRLVRAANFPLLYGANGSLIDGQARVQAMASLYAQQYGLPHNKEGWAAAMEMMLQHGVPDFDAFPLSGDGNWEDDDVSEDKTPTE